MKGFGQGWTMVQGSGSRRAHHGNGCPCGQGNAQSVVRGRTFIDAHPHLNVGVMVEGENDGGISGTWAHHRVLDAFLGEHFSQHGCSRM